MKAPGLILIGVGGAAGVGAACAAAVLVVVRLAPGLQSPALFAVLAATLGVLLGVILLPLLGAASSGIARMGAAMAEAAESGDAGSYRPPAWLRQLASSAQGTLKAWSDRCERLNTRLREAEIRLSVCESERQHCEAILHTLRDAVLVTDAFNELTLANEPAARLLGFDLGDSAHKPIDSLLGDETLRGLIKDVRQSGILAKQKRIEHTLESSSQGDAAKVRSSFDVTIACLPDVQQGVGGVVTILRDITREKEISQMKSDFVSQASHELRTPLSAINAYVEMLLDSEAGDEASRQEFYQIIKSEADRVSRMIDNMLNISRIEAGIVSVDRTEVDFAKVIREVIETMQPQAKAKSIMLIEKAGPLIYTADADRDMMYQVVMNLVSNALKYTPDAGRVTVSVENDDATRSVLVGVADTGLGIPPDALGKLFEKFFRIENYKRVAKGTGLGLNLVKHIVKTVHHGEVGVTSEVGMGSRFWFSVPYEFQGG